MKIRGLALGVATVMLTATPAVAAPPVTAAPKATPKGKAAPSSAKKSAAKQSVAKATAPRLKLVAGQGAPDIVVDEDLGWKPSSIGASAIEVLRLERGEKAVISPDHPLDQGIGLFARGVAVWALGPSGTPPAVSVPGDGARPVPARPFAGFVLGAYPMQGDDLKVVCTGDFPARVDATATLFAVAAAQRATTTQRLDGSSGKVKFFVSTPALSVDGYLKVALSTPTKSGLRLYQCTIERDNS